MPSPARQNLLVLLALVAYVVFLSWDGLSNPTVEGLDGAHHVMDGAFFHDFLVDRPFDSLGSYPYDYYAQYPALGFIFWPPLFPFVEGLFFLAAGELDLWVAQLCLLSFSVLALLAGFFLLRPRLGLALTCLTLVTLFGLSEFVLYQNQVRLELPAIAMGLWSVALYQSIVSRKNPKLWRLLLFALVGAGTLYTKQTTFPILVAIALDLLLNHRQLLRNPRIVGSGALLILLTIPLALFTLKYGKSNIAQSLGNGTDTIMEGYVGAARFSLESWLFYPRGLGRVLNPALLVLAGMGLVRCLSNKKFCSANLIWLAWIGCFYLAFSYFDNRTLRFAMLLYPPLVFLAAAALGELLQSAKIVKGRGLLTGLLILISVGLGVRNARAHVLAGFQGVGAMMQSLDIQNARGNLAYQGRYRQLFVFPFRQQDPQREHYFLQADDILTTEQDLQTQLSRYRVQYILVESDQLKLLQQLQGRPEVLRTVRQIELESPRQKLQLTLFEFRGPLADQMTPPPLESKLL